MPDPTAEARALVEHLDEVSELYRRNLALAIDEHTAAIARERDNAQRQLTEEMDAHAETKTRLAEVERERDELRAEYDDRERRARRQERDLMRESQDARLTTLTATLREVREDLARAKANIDADPLNLLTVSTASSIVNRTLARCDAVLKHS